MRTFAGGLGVLIAALSFAATAAESPDGPYVTQQMIDAQGGVQFSLPRFGTFTIDAIEAPPGGGECHVSLESVATDIAASIETGELDLKVGKKKAVKLKVFIFPDGRVKCYGPGKGCKAYVTVTSVDAPTIEPL